MRKFKVTVNGETYLVEVEEIRDETQKIKAVRPVRVEKASSIEPLRTQNLAFPGHITAPLPGVISDLNVTVGAKVEAGDILLVLEAMKMENEIYASTAGFIEEVCVEVGQQVGRGDLLVKIG